MAESQKFSIRNIVKKETLPRIIFSSFYIYMHEDGGKLAMSRQLPHELCDGRVQQSSAFPHVQSMSGDPAG
jgi:hypothetical protein